MRIVCFKWSMINKTALHNGQKWCGTSTNDSFPHMTIARVMTCLFFDYCGIAYGINVHKKPFVVEHNTDTRAKIHCFRQLNTPGLLIARFEAYFKTCDTYNPSNNNIENIILILHIGNVNPASMGCRPVLVIYF